jgi:hypothetical protein
MCIVKNESGHLVLDIEVEVEMVLSHPHRASPTFVHHQLERQHRHRNDASHISPTPAQAFRSNSLALHISPTRTTLNRRHRLPKCLADPPPAARIASAQMHINTSPPPRPDIARRAKTAIATVEEQAGAQGRVSESRHNEAQETQFGRAQDCEGAIEHRKGHHGVYSGRRYGMAFSEGP